MTGYPEKLIIEPTTFCNFKCSMCVKQSDGCDITEGELSQEMSDLMIPLYKNAKSVVFTGIGEPLLNRNLETCILQAKELMPEKGRVGFQTNGLLLSNDRAESLLQAGVDRICISIDSVQDSLFSGFREGGTFQGITSAFNSLNRAQKATGKHSFQSGIEFVLMKKNYKELPRVVRWAAEKGARYVLVSHLSTYHSDTETGTVFGENLDSARELFSRYQVEAEKKGLKLDHYRDVLWNYKKSDMELALLRFVKEMKRDAVSKDIFLNMDKLFDEDRHITDKITSVFEETKEIGDHFGMRIDLPAIRPTQERVCRFIEENCMFVTWDGNISPCYFLWHKYNLMRNGSVKHVTPINFGNIVHNNPLNVWNSDDYREFRKKVKLYDYPHCINCSITPCSYILDEPFQTDCYSIDIPCGDCYWNMGLYNCLM